MRRSTGPNKRWYAVITAVFWLVVWQLASVGLPRFLFAGPVQTVQSLLVMFQNMTFWAAIWGSLGKIAVGYLLAFVAGCALAILCSRFFLLKLLLEPVAQVMKSVPVACFVIVALIWVRSPYISVLTVFFVVFPITYVNLSEGLSQVDTQLLEMAAVFHVSRKNQLRYLYLPAFMPYLTAGCRVAVGMAWKSGIAGEIIGLPSRSIGEQLYLSKLYLNMDDLFAWTLVIIAISLLCERLMVRLLNKVGRKWEAPHGN